MSTKDLDAIRARQAEADARDLLVEVERLQRDYEDAHADRLARTLERDRTIDEREYLKAEVERLRAELVDERATHAKTIDNFEAFAEGRAFDDDAAPVSAVLCMRCCPAVLLGAEEIQQHNETLHAAVSTGDGTRDG